MTVHDERQVDTGTTGTTGANWSVGGRRQPGSGPRKEGGLFPQAVATAQTG